MVEIPIENRLFCKKIDPSICRIIWTIILRMEKRGLYVKSVSRHPHAMFLQIILCKETNLPPMNVSFEINNVKHRSKYKRTIEKY